MVDLEINKEINDEYLWVLHGRDVELHVGGADQQELRWNLKNLSRGLNPPNPGLN